MDIDMADSIGIKDAMTYNVITAKSNATVSEIAAIMTENDISSVVILDDEVEGIVSSSNIISKVVSKNIAPKDITADMVMTDYVSIGLNASLIEASSIMLKNNSKLVLVMEDKELKGIISQTDIVRVSPELIELFVEQSSIDEKAYLDDVSYKTDYDENLDEGVCEKCGVYNQLEEFNGQFLCSDCMDESDDN
ncbi:MAG: CBS domain-containing protein [Methanosphaera sp.]|nr:CBS domain-containing protein [Methanosphaera sp.]